MKQAIVLLAEGFEELEAVGTIDVLRRAGVDCRAVGLIPDAVTGAHGLTVRTDALLTGEEQCDLVVLPGGLPGAYHLRDDARVAGLLLRQNERGGLIGAICAAPLVLGGLGLLSGRRATCYPSESTRQQLTGAILTEGDAVRDGHIITGRGPALVLPFAYALVEALGLDASAVQKAMLYRG